MSYFKQFQARIPYEVVVYGRFNTTNRSYSERVWKRMGAPALHHQPWCTKNLQLPTPDLRLTRTGFWAGLVAFQTVFPAVILSVSTGMHSVTVACFVPSQGHA